MELLCIATGLVAAALALALTPLVRAAALRVGFVDRPGPRKIHREPMAYGGGIAVALAMLAVLALAWLAVGRVLADAGYSAWRAELGLAAEQFDPALLRTLGVCLAGALGALVLGVLDDRFVFSPPAKLAGQFALAIAVVAGGVRITALIGDTLPMQAATVLWIVLITNSFNLLDNMDGLCTGTVAIASAVLGMVAMSSGQGTLAVALAALSGACLGFLKWNLSPARIFLGDAGSMFVGFLMAALSVVTTYYTYRESVLSVGVPFLILAIPLYDTASVMFIRLREGRALLKGDNSHFSHRLVDLGMTHRQAVSTIHLAALAIALPAAAIRNLSAQEGLLLVGQALLILTLIALLERAGRMKQKPPEAGDGSA
ncbi:MAG: undecaprenyl/decaprenyl-phosphate alpha-N-acetylglucosaminyl 1-phosphate transferase [Planctomycetota bacterium]|nr:undecaprenyl/decaprenyl-phosphate alpha-N-acetylglucosaminyl 1-phosphate transferase [Planctomycetota bacterium]